MKSFKKNIIVIALTGADNSGKTTMAEKIKDRLADEFIVARVVQLSEPVKNIAKIFGFDNDKRKTHAKHREILVDITNIGIKFNEEIWSDMFIDMVMEENEHYGVDVFIVDDSRYDYMSRQISNKVRYFNEYKIVSYKHKLLYKTMIEDIVEYVIELKEEVDCTNKLNLSKTLTKS